MIAQVAQILFPVNVAGPFDYQVPPGLSVSIGNYVYAPLGSQTKLGVVWALRADDSHQNSQTDKRQDHSLKDIAQVKATRPLSKKMIEFVNWTARYNCTSQGMVLRMIMRSYKALDPSPMVTRYSPSGHIPAKMTPARRAVLDKGEPFPARASDIAKRSKVSASVIKGLAKAGGLDRFEAPLDPPFGVPDPERPGLDLTPSQSEAADGLIFQLKSHTFNVTLLDGVTGSGKTEVYLEAVAEMIRAGRQVLVLVPEIALTQAGLSRFSERFGTEPAAWHSALGEAARRRTWREVTQGRAKLIIGARSALYLPFRDLGLVVVDEEHDTSYKQEEGVIYNARDMAIVRGMIFGHSVILASATPSLESLVNARNGRYRHIKLPERPGAITLPDIGLVDLKEQSPEPGKFLSEPLIEAMREVLSQGEQALLYLNRRGYAPLIICRSCGKKLKSPDTDSWLVEHRRTGRAICHLTGFSMPMPKSCPHCHEKDSLVSVGPGVERVADEVGEYFNTARIEIFSSDTAGNAQKIQERMARMAAGDIDILVGTQMVVKGHNFPRLTFVGVVDGDLSLAGGDLRAGERTYQTLVQVAGRAGRADRPGRALIQTHQPEHETFQALLRGDRDYFIASELAMREGLELPPFGKLAAIIISAQDEGEAEKLVRSFIALAPRADGVTLYGPSEPPLGRLRGWYRRRILVQARSDINLSAYMHHWRSRQNRLPTRTKLQIDIDPQSFM